MTAEDWYRNTEWTERIAARFEEKLRKARRKEQYLRIQASTLAARHPEVALALLDRYFALRDDFDHAQAYVDRATALLSLDRMEDAIASYEAALNREDLFPNLLTQAYVDLPYLVAVREVETRYDRALELLDKHKARLMFPVDHFKWHAARALISASRHDQTSAKAHAKLALEAASRDKSGFQHHPGVGLVTSRQNEVLQRLVRYCDA
jgi:tetratricopeptide (TPR) repeat protein